MTVDEFIRLVEILRWPLVILVVYFCSRESIFKLIEKYGHVEVGSSAVKIILKRLETEYNVSSTQIKKLHGLTGHDFWALDAFIKQPEDSYKYINKFTATRKAMAFSFVEMGLLEIAGEGNQKYVQSTQLAADVIEAANKLM